MATSRSRATTTEHAIVLVGLAVFFTVLIGATFRAYFSVVEEHHVLTSAGRSLGDWARLAGDDAVRFGRVRPLYFAFHFVRAALCGANPLALHLLTTALGIATCFLFYVAARRLGADIVSALVVILLLALTENEASIWYLFTPQETFGMLLTAAAVVALVAAASGHRSARCDGLAVACMALAGLTKESFILVIPALLMLRLSARCWLTGERFTAALRGMKWTVLAGMAVFTAEMGLVVAVVVLKPSSYGPQVAGLSLRSFDPRVWLEIAVSPPLRAVATQVLISVTVLGTIALRPDSAMLRPHLARAIVAAMAWLLPQMALYSHGMNERYLFPALVSPAAVIALGLAVLWRWRSWSARLAWLAIAVSLLPLVSRGVAETTALAGQHTADTQVTEEMVRYVARHVPAQQMVLIAADPGTAYGFEAAFAIPIFLRREGSRSPAYVWPVQDPLRRTSLHMGVIDDTMAALARPAGEGLAVGAVVVPVAPTDIGPIPPWLEDNPWRAISFTRRYSALTLSRLRYVERGRITKTLLVPGAEGPAAPADRPIVTVGGALKEDLGINVLLRTPPWGVEPLRSDSVLWLGDGPEASLGVMVWSGKAQRITVQCDVLAGPGRPDSGRTVEMSFGARQRVVRERRTFDRQAVLSFTGQLSVGRNHLTLTTLDQATVRRRPDGDTRPLMVLLRRMSLSAADAPEPDPERGAGRTER